MTGNSQVDRLDDVVIGAILFLGPFIVALDTCVYMFAGQDAARHL